MLLYITNYLSLRGIKKWEAFEREKHLFSQMSQFQQNNINYMPLAKISKEFTNSRSSISSIDTSTVSGELRFFKITTST